VYKQIAARAPDSSDAFVRARRALAGGVDSPVRAGAAVGAPTPFIDQAHGARVLAADGREYIDYVCGYGPVLLGHADPRVSERVSHAVANGAVFGATHHEEVRLAERLLALFPSIERLRFVTTGTEACMSAVRLARSLTRREKIIRFEGCYHGHSDEMIFSAGASTMTGPTVASGISGGVIHDVLVLPYNDIFAVDRTLRGRRNEVAAIIVEPICGNMGLCLPAPKFLEGLRDLCRSFGVILIFDEVITGLRVGSGGAQALYGIRPDITCLGKALGGGLPIAAFGGRGDVMAKLAPDGPVFQGGTFSGNPVCVAAAHAVLDAIEGEPDFYAKLEAKSRRLADGLRRIMAQQHLEFPVVQCASMIDFMFRRGQPHQTMAQAREADANRFARYYHAMLERGILLPPSQFELMFLTAAHDEDDIDATLRAASDSLRISAAQG